MRHTSLRLFLNHGDVWDTVSCEGLVSFSGEVGMELILWRKTFYNLVRVAFSHSNKWRPCFHIFQIGLLHYLLCFLCFLAAPTCIADKLSNSLPGTLLQSSSSFYLLRSSVQILWMLTDFCHWMGHQCILTITSHMPGSFTSLITDGQSSRSPIWKMWKQGLHLLECENATLTKL